MDKIIFATYDQHNLQLVDEVIKIDSVLDSNSHARDTPWDVKNEGAGQIHPFMDQEFFDTLDLSHLNQFFDHLDQHISHYVSEPYKLRRWFNINPPGSYNCFHTHGGNPMPIYSGVFYISVPEDSGNIVFVDGSTEFAYEPVDGDIIMFPPDLQHGVEPNLSDYNRMSMAFNILPKRQISC